MNDQQLDRARSRTIDAIHSACQQSLVRQEKFLPYAGVEGGNGAGHGEFLFLCQGAVGRVAGRNFEHWARLCIAESLWDFAPTARLFTLTEEEMRGDRRLTRFEMVEEGGKQLYYFELWNPPRDYGLPLELRPRFPYWHLFGDNGEKRPEHQLSTR